MKIRVSARDIASTKAGAIVVNVYEKAKSLEGDTAAVDKALDGAISRLIEEGGIKGKLNELTLIHSLGKLPAERVAVCGLGKVKELTTERIRGAVGEICRFLRPKGVEKIATVTQGAGVNGISAEDAAQAVTEGALLGLYAFRRHKSKPNGDFGEIKRLVIAGSARTKPARQQGSARGMVLAEAANLARDLANEPSNYMTPSHLAEAARKLAESHGLEISVLEREQMAQEGMGALLGVAQGSLQPPRFIVLHYKGNSTRDRIDVALVGKGITFDSGGISIKPSEKMEEMKGDMAGGAAVMAAISAIARLQAQANVMAVIPATENMPSGGALKPGDVLTAMNGKTIEIISTDAEGRLILADALSYTKKQGARFVIDVATLTGSCQVALGNICSGAFGNNQRLMNRLLATANAAGERAWQLPMFAEYTEQIKSDVADIKNAGGRYAGAITAAKFLEEFIDGTPWAHLDIAGTSDTDKDKGYLVKGATGVPVRTLVNLVMELAGEKKAGRIEKKSRRRK